MSRDIPNAYEHKLSPSVTETFEAAGGSRETSQFSCEFHICEVPPVLSWYSNRGFPKQDGIGDSPGYARWIRKHTLFLHAQFRPLEKRDHVASKRTLRVLLSRRDQDAAH